MIAGDNGANFLSGGAGNDLIYGFDPNGPQSVVTSIQATRVAAGLNQPLFAFAPPGDYQRLFVVEKAGLIKILDLATQQVLPTPFVDVRGQILTGGEQGLLGLAFDPAFQQNGYFYVNLINVSGDTEVRRYQLSNLDPNLADASTATTILTIDQPTGLSNHKAGWMDFGSDGYLYIAVGDGGSGGDPFNFAQNPNSLLGKMLRIDIRSDAFPSDPSRNYAIPGENMFVGVAGADEVWAMGLRNPWRNSFDRATGELYIADVGQNAWEEVNIGRAGANYGWKIFEGPSPFSPGTPQGGGTLTAPAYVYGDGVIDGTSSQSITGGYVYRGPSEGLHGAYFFADFSTNKISTLRFDGITWVAVDRTSQIVANVGSIGSPASYGQDGTGNLYVVDLAGGELFRLTPQVNSIDQGDVLLGLDGSDILFGGSGDDMLDGGSGNDELQGGSGADQLLGGAGNDRILGVLGNDTQTGGAGNDTIDGGGGADTVVFNGLADQFAFLRYQGALTVVDRIANRDGADQLINVETLRFGDKALIFDEITGFTSLEYIASFGDLIAAFGSGARLGYHHFINNGVSEGRVATFNGLEYIASYGDLMSALGANDDRGATHFIQYGRFEGRQTTFNGLEYVASYSDLMNALGINEDRGATHFIQHGRFEGRQTAFNGLEYIASYGDLMDALGANEDRGASHFIQYGRFENRQVSFNPLEYIASYGDLIAAIGANPDQGAKHYISNGRFEGRSLRFDAAQYLANYVDLRAAFGSDLQAATEHFIVFGFYEGRTDQV